MRIAEVAPPWLAVPPNGYGGIEWIVSLLADALADGGHEVTLFGTGDSTTRAGLDFAHPKAPGSAMINDVWYDTLHTLHAFRDPERFDLYHVHSPWSSLAVASRVGRPVVHTVHGSFTPEMKRLYSYVADRIWFVAISEAQRRQMPELPYAGVVHNGIDLSLYPVQEEKGDFVLFLGRAVPEKGALRAILAAREAGVRLVMAVKVAHPSEEEHWEREVRPLVPEDATVLGEIGIDEKIELLSRARAVLFPIDWEEPFGMVMTEAMACGTPVIATPRGAVPEVVADGETGFVVPVDGYPQEAAAALARLDGIDPRACRRRVEQLFSKEAMVAGYEAAFGRAVASLPSGPSLVA